MPKASSKRPKRSSPAKRKDPPKLDLSQFTSLDEAMARVEPRDRYIEVGKLVMPIDGDGMPLTLATLFWFSMITRSQGLHSAIAREIRKGNPHAVFPLIRAFAETVVLVNYVHDHPKYIEALTSRPSERREGGPKRKSIQALINYASQDAPGMKYVYSELSEVSHFGSTAMWAAYNVEGESTPGSTSWASYPRWRSDQDALIACAHTLELANGMEFFLRRFCERHVLPPSASKSLV